MPAQPRMRASCAPQQADQTNLSHGTLSAKPARAQRLPASGGGRCRVMAEMEHADGVASADLPSERSALCQPRCHLDLRARPESGRSALRFPMKRLPTSGAASPRPVGPTGRRSRTIRKASSSRPSRELARYWATEYDWRMCEERLNSLPQFMTEIDELDIHFIHVRSKHHDALPLIVTHGWPGSVIEQLKIIGRLTDPTAHGASAADAFHRWFHRSPATASRASPPPSAGAPPASPAPGVALMKRLGYSRFVAQGGDWGGLITEVMATQAPPELLGCTPTSRRPCRPRWTRRSSPVALRQPRSHRTNDVRTNN